MSIEKITSRILGEAEAERDITLAEARARSEAVLAEAEKNAATLLADAERRGKIEKDKIITRRKSVADIDCRKVFLLGRWAGIPLGHLRQGAATRAHPGKKTGNHRGMLRARHRRNHRHAEGSVHRIAGSSRQDLGREGGRADF